MFMWTDAIERGPEMTALRDGVRGKDKLDVPIKMIWNYAGNCLINQHSEINRTHEILQDDKKCEMIVVIDCPYDLVGKIRRYSVAGLHCF
ncbi:anaerobic dimethyl sulfoxide reductase subunit A [Salmonella enterica subsp. enterica]|nr:anaerobic dimethyl sulfoxide reductase subunit A [Salmonella enterica subsp. enterica]